MKESELSPMQLRIVNLKRREQKEIRKIEIREAEEELDNQFLYSITDKGRNLLKGLK